MKKHQIFRNSISDDYITEDGNSPVKVDDDPFKKDYDYDDNDHIEVITI